MRILAGVVSLYAGNGAEVLVDCAKVVVREMAEVRPGHDLQEISIEWTRDAVCIGRAGARRMEVIGIDAGANGVEEMLEAIPADRFAAGIGSEVARDDFGRAGNQRAEVSAAAEVGGWVGLLRLIEVRIAAGEILARRAGGVAAIAVAGNVYEVASETYECDILAFHIEGHRSGVQADLDA